MNNLNESSEFDYEFGNNYGLIEIGQQNISYNFQLKEQELLNIIPLKEDIFKYNSTSTAFISCLLAFVIFMI